MLSSSIGERLEQMVSMASSEVVLCAPFIKHHVMERLLVLRNEASSVKVFTRWRPEEVALGVSDPSILKLVKKAGGEVRLIDRVHAKYFRCDEAVLVGSANLTGAALGWAQNTNLELVQEAEWSKSARDFESELLALSTSATAEIAEAVEALARELPQPAVSEAYGFEESAEWWPCLREPKDLWLAYSGGSHRMTRLSSEASRTDLLALDVPPGLDMAQFRALVAVRLLQHQNIAAIDEFLETSRRFGEVRDQISQMSGYSRYESSQRWQALMRWFLEYCPGRFEVSVPRHSEVMRKVEG